jgi:hypothetical protein
MTIKSEFKLKSEMNPRRKQGEEKKNNLRKDQRGQQE